MILYMISTSRNDFKNFWVSFTCSHMNNDPFWVIRSWITGVVSRISNVRLGYNKRCDCSSSRSFINHNCSSPLSIVCDYLCSKMNINITKMKNNGGCNSDIFTYPRSSYHIYVEIYVSAFYIYPHLYSERLYTIVCKETKCNLVYPLGLIQYPWGFYQNK